jgi:hypothetical protein
MLFHTAQNPLTANDHRATNQPSSKATNKYYLQKDRFGFVLSTHVLSVLIGVRPALVSVPTTTLASPSTTFNRFHHFKASSPEK